MYLISKNLETQQQVKIKNNGSERSYLPKQNMQKNTTNSKYQEIEVSKEKNFSKAIKDELEKISKNDSKNVVTSQFHSSDLHAGHLTGNLLIITLGKGEDEVFASQASWLFVQDGHNVSVIVYGHKREEPFPTSARVIGFNFTKIKK